MGRDLFRTKEVIPAVAVEPAKTNLPVTPDALIDMGFDPAENLHDETPEMLIIKVLPQAQMFELPDGSNTKTLEGVIVHTHRCNGWWDPKNPEDGNRPSCSSINDLKPLDNSPRVQSATCADCPLNQFGSEIDPSGAKGKGKSCKNMRRVFILLPEHEIPYLLSLSPTSLRSAKKYLTQLSDLKRHIATVVTRIVLRKETKGSNVFSIAEFELVKNISDLGYLAGIARIKRQVEKIAGAVAITEKERPEQEADPF